MLYNHALLLCRERLAAFYRKHNPAMLDKCDAILAKYRGHEEVRLQPIERDGCCIPLLVVDARFISTAIFAISRSSFISSLASMLLQEGARK